MFFQRSDESMFLQVNRAGSLVTLFEVSVFGGGARSKFIAAKLQEIDGHCSVPTAVVETGTEEKSSQARQLSALRPNALCIVLRDGQPAAVKAAQQKLRTSDARIKFLILCDTPPEDTHRELKMACNAAFVTSDINLTMLPIEVVMSPPGLIGIDYDDFSTVWSDRWNYVERIRVSDIETAVRASLPLEGLALSFSGVSLAELDATVTRVKKLIPKELDLVWHDANLKGVTGQWVDACFAYDEFPEGFARARALGRKASQ